MRASDNENPAWKEFIPPFKPPTKDHIKEHTLYLLSKGKSEKQIIETIKHQFSDDHHETIENAVMHEIQDLKKQNFIQETGNTSYSLTENGKNHIKELKKNARLMQKKIPIYYDSKCPRLIVGESCMWARTSKRQTLLRR